MHVVLYNYDYNENTNTLIDTSMTLNYFTTSIYAKHTYICISLLKQ